MIVLSVLLWLVAIGLGSFALNVAYYRGKQLRNTKQLKLLTADFNNYQTPNVGVLRDPRNQLSGVYLKNVYPNTIDGDMPCHLQKLESIELTREGENFIRVSASERKGVMDCRIPISKRKYDYLFLKEREYVHE